MFNWNENINTKKRKTHDSDDEDDNLNDHSNDTFNDSQLIRSDGSDVYFYAQITKKTIINLQKNIKKVVDNVKQKVDDAEKIGCIVTYPPIKLHINSPGGSIFAAFTFIDTMTQIKLNNPKIKFHTIIEGGSASAATLISVTGDRRFISNYGYMLIHQLSGMNWGKYQELKDDMKNSKDLMCRIKSIYKTYTRLDEKELNKILKHDLYWDSEKCLENGLVDEILK